VITVRFPSGVAVQYNDAHWIERGEHYTDLRDKRGGRLLAQVPTRGCIVEFVRPCRVYSSNHEPSDLVDALNRALADPAIRARLNMPGLAEIKRRLRDLDIKRWIWKGED
jgi:hypothetical protein